MTQVEVLNEIKAIGTAVDHIAERLKCLVLKLNNNPSVLPLATIPETPFDEIYAKGSWGNGSGHGSSPDYTAGYRDFLQKWLVSHQIKTVVDIGCGDWQFSNLVNWKGIDYTGIDCVKSVVDKNNATYAIPGRIRFLHHNILVDEWQTPCDLIILKDVIQHWPNEAILRVLPALRKMTKQLLITNCSNGARDGADCPLGGWRPLSHTLEPLANFKGKLVYSFHTKVTSVISGEI